MPKVSIALPCYNHSRFLIECVSSILGQTEEDWELVIYNDGSTDETHDTAAQLAKLDGRIRCGGSSKNKGIAFARNAAISECTSSLILNADADCYFGPEILSKFLTANKFMQGDIIYSWYQHIEEDGTIRNLQKQPLCTPQKILEQCIITIAAMYPRTLWERSGGYKCKFNFGGEDWEFWINLIHNYGAIPYCIKEPLFFYRWHDDMITRRILNTRMSELDIMLRKEHKSIYEK